MNQLTAQLIDQLFGQSNLGKVRLIVSSQSSGGGSIPLLKLKLNII